MPKTVITHYSSRSQRLKDTELRAYLDRRQYAPSNPIGDLPTIDEKTIQHYGVKGMRWGIRKDRKKGGQRAKSAEQIKKTPFQKVKRWAKENPDQAVAVAATVGALALKLGTIAVIRSTETQAMNAYMRGPNPVPGVGFTMTDSKGRRAPTTAEVDALLRRGGFK